MRWLKINHIEGYDLINISHVYKIEVRQDENQGDRKSDAESSVYEIALYDANSIMATVFSWETSTERDRVLKKLKEVLNIAEI